MTSEVLGVIWASDEVNNIIIDKNIEPNKIANRSIVNVFKWIDISRDRDKIVSFFVSFTFETYLQSQTRTYLNVHVESI